MDLLISNFCPHIARNVIEGVIAVVQKSKSLLPEVLLSWNGAVNDNRVMCCTGTIGGRG